MPRERVRRSFIFATNQHKAATKVTINSVMTGSLFFILTLVLAGDPQKFNPLVLGEIVLAIPMLFVSALTYTKISFAEDRYIWDAFGWFTSNIGTIFTLNSIGLITAAIYPQLGLAYFYLLLILMAIYSLINIYYKPHTSGERLFKFLFFAAVLITGGLIPLLG